MAKISLPTESPALGLAPIGAGTFFEFVPVPPGQQATVLMLQTV